MELTDIQREVFRSIMWDYTYTPEEVAECLLGDAKRCGHYTKENLFRKLIENVPWFTVLQVLPKEKIREYLSSGIYQKLRFKDMRREYAEVHKRLQEALQYPR